MGCLRRPSARRVHFIVSPRNIITLSPSHHYQNSQELRKSVFGYQNNSYRCCKSVEEGEQALREFRAQQPDSISPRAPVMGTVPNSTQPKRLDVAVSPADSWWFCFSGAEPGVYKGVYVISQ